MGGYSKRKQEFVFSTIHAHHYPRLKKELQAVDPNIFIVAVSAYEQKNANQALRAYQG